MEDDYPGGWFGESWGAPVCDPAAHKPTPIGEPCMYCERLIEVDDQGLVMPHYGVDGFRLAATHLDCFLPQIGH